MQVKTCDILRFETRGNDFALVRIAADGTRSELLLTSTNVVHLGLLAPVFSRRLLANKVGKRSAAVAASFKHRWVGTNLRIFDVLLAALDRTGRHADWMMMEQRARMLASRLIERADRLAKAPRARR
jgi:hypothetical protein